MKLRNLLAATALVAAIGANAQGVKYVINHNPEVDLSTLTTDKDGFYVLFDGKSLDGWRGYQKDYIRSKWNLKDGCLHFNGRGEGEGGDIIFAHQFKNFVFEVEWKISEGGNSGIFYLAQESASVGQDGKLHAEPIYISCPECQVLDNERHPDAKLGAVLGIRQSSSLYDMIPAKPQNANPAGQWNKVKIVVKNGKVTHYQNGVKVLSYKMWGEEWINLLQSSKFAENKWPIAFELLKNCGGDGHKGYFGFQDHGDEVWYRNIRVKALK